jgi:ABC-type uncharacterized transport system permease subunit
MDNNTIILGLAGVIAAAAPILFAVIGETITERAGVINLSVNGTILLSAMGGFAIAVNTNNLILGFLAGMVIGGLVALIVAFSSITYMGIAGPRLSSLPIPVIKNIPIFGPLLFRQDLMTYLSIALIFVAYFYIFKTRPGLILRGIGERPSASYARGANVNRLRYIYTIVGGMLVGLAGPVYSLSVKAGWKGTISGLDGIGWIALSITIFGGWNPIRAAFGAYLFSFLQWLGLVLQPRLPNVPSQVLQVAPFPLMILTLLLVNIGNTEWVERMLASMNAPTRRIIASILRKLNTSPPASLGVPFETD